jgi:hypothetical protein
MATRLEGAASTVFKTGCATVAQATIPVAPRNCLREKLDFVIGVTSGWFFSMIGLI